MAVSKNNRRKKTKRTQNHCAPAGFGQKQQAKVAAQQEQEAIEKKRWRISMLALVFMVVGFLIAAQGNRFIGYPITFVGGVLGLYSARTLSKGRKITIVCYTIYCVLVAYMWIFEFLV